MPFIARFKKLAMRYSLVLGTTILLFSWIIEKYQVAYWNQKAAALTELRAQATQSLILAQSKAIYLTQESAIRTATPLLEKNTDVVDTFSAYDQAFRLLRQDLSEPYQEGVDEVALIITQTLEKYVADVNEHGERRLSEDETVDLNVIVRPLHDLVSVGDHYMANQVFLEAGMEQLRALGEMTQVLEDHEEYRDEIQGLEVEMHTFAQSITAGKPAGTPVTDLTGRLYDVTRRIGDALHAYANEVNRKKYRYASVYRSCYIMGSFLVLTSMILRGTARSTANAGKRGPT